MNWTALEEDLIRDEGLRLRAYYCPAGKKTIGVGHMLRKHEMNVNEISLTEAGRLLRLDIKQALDDLRAVFGLHCLDLWSEQRQRALANMMFNLGRARFGGFVKTIAAIRRGMWDEAADEVLDSKYARQVGERAQRIAEALREG
jgi:lysozyme